MKEKTLNMPDGEHKTLFWKVRYTYKFTLQLLEVSDIEFERIEGSISFVEQNPDAGSLYDPEYPAFKPNVDCFHKVVPGTHKEIFYVKNTQVKELVLICLTDTRMDPLTKLSGEDFFA